MNSTGLGSSSGRLRTQSAHGQRQGTWFHWRHPGQTRIHPGLQRQPGQRPDDSVHKQGRMLHCWPDKESRSGRPDYVRIFQAFSNALHQYKIIICLLLVRYAARDVTATVDNINLATASIISKKAAENISSLVLDVKVGRAAFFKSFENARQVAERLVETAQNQGIKTFAVLSTMDTPIGTAIGNSLEVIEVVQTLRGDGVADLVELVQVQGGLLLWAAGKAESAQEGEEKISSVLKNGTALAHFEQMLVQQGVDVHLASSLCSGDSSVLARAKYITPLLTPCAGYVVDIDALTCGVICGALGAARARTSDAILPAVGIELLVRLGERVEEGQPWARLHHESDQLPNNLLDNLLNAIVVGPIQEHPMEPSRILEIIQ